MTRAKRVSAKLRVQKQAMEIVLELLQRRRERVAKLVEAYEDHRFVEVANEYKYRLAELADFQRAVVAELYNHKYWPGY